MYIFERLKDKAITHSKLTNSKIVCTFNYGELITFYVYKYTTISHLQSISRFKIFFSLFFLIAVSLDSSFSLDSQSSSSNLLSAPGNERETRAIDYNGLDFRIIIDSKSGPPVTITLVASTVQEKAAWCSDIGQV